MSMSIYYTAKRETPLTSSERAKIEQLCDAFAVESEIKAYLRTGQGPNWESFCVYESAKGENPNVIFEGATGLPTNSQDHLWEGVQHWCGLLTEIRRTLPDAEWDVRVEDHEIHWDETNEAYDPSA